MLPEWLRPIGVDGPVDALIVAAYLLCGVICWRASRATAHRGFWRLVALLCLTFGTFKALDVQDHLGGWVRQVARSQGWYEGRRLIQVGALLALSIAIVAGFIWIRFGRLSRVSAGRAWWSVPGMAAGTAGMLALFVLIRAMSLHHIDIVLHRLPGVEELMNVGIELSLLGLLSALAIGSARRRD